MPGAKLLVRKVNSTTRKTKYSIAMVYQGDELISLNSILPNHFVQKSLEHSKLPSFENYSLIKPEYTIGKHRFDFLLEKAGKKCILEIKSATLVEKGIAQFPDAVTERGRSHVNSLVKLQKEGFETAVMFVVQRSDAKRFIPHWERDPKFSEALFS